MLASERRQRGILGACVGVGGLGHRRRAFGVEFTRFKDNRDHLPANQTQYNKKKKESRQYASVHYGSPRTVLVCASRAQDVGVDLHLIVLLCKRQRLDAKVGEEEELHRRTRVANPLAEARHQFGACGAPRLAHHRKRLLRRVEVVEVELDHADVIARQFKRRLSLGVLSGRESTGNDRGHVNLEQSTKARN